MSDDKPSIPEVDGSDLYFCIVAARFNTDLVDALLERAIAALKASKVRDANITVMRVPGSNELPYGVYMQSLTRQFDCIIALGVVIAGETDHHSIIAQSTAQAFHGIGAQTEIPVINGIITVSDRAQAESRCMGAHDRGAEFAHAALEMASHKLNLTDTLDELEADVELDEDDDDFEDLFRKN